MKNKEILNKSFTIRIHALKDTEIEELEKWFHDLMSLLGKRKGKPIFLWAITNRIGFTEEKT